MPKKLLYTRLSADPNARAKLFLRSFNEGYRLHRHYFFEFEFVIEGSAVHVLNGVPHTFKKGDICFITPTTIHQFLPSGDNVPLEMYTLSFSSDIVSPEVWQFIPVRDSAFSKHLSDEDFAAAKGMFESLSAYSTSESLEINTFTTIGIEWLILNLFRNAGQELELNAAISSAIVFVQSNFSNPITLKDVADTVYLSAPYFSNLFRNSMGISFQTYLLNLRLDFSADLLALTDLSVSKICEESGFRTLAYFSRAFKHRFGYAPEIFRMKKKS